MTIYLSNKSGSGIYPNLIPAKLSSAIATRLMTKNAVPGFLKTGDVILLPFAITGTVDYYNAAGSLVWSKAVTDVDASCDNWVGFYLDYTDNLLYGVAIDTGATPDEFYTFSVNAAGTLVNIGNANPTTAFTAAPAWHNYAIVDGSSILQRASQGSGDLTIRAAHSAGWEEAVIDYTDGSFSVDTVGRASAFGEQIVAPYETDEGNFFSIGDEKAFFFGNIVTPISRFSLMNTGISVEDGDAQFWGIRFIEWGTLICAIVGNGATEFNVGPKFYEKEAFDVWVDQMCAIVGAT